MSTAEDVRMVTLHLPRAYEAIVRERTKFRVGRIVFATLSCDESILGFAYPREQRDALIVGEPHKFHYPRKSDMRYQWVQLWLSQVESDELTELLVEAWAMCVPKFLLREYLATNP